MGRLRLVSKFNIKNVERWVPFFSQTGSEIMDIIAYTGYIPDKIVTNIPLSESDSINKVLFERFHDKLVYLPKKPTVEEYQTAIGESRGTLVTLHGWLRIVPKEICKEYKIYNGHPGLITKYPELKGRDPQMKAFLGNYDSGGSVIHEVIPEVDEGKILLQREVDLLGLNLDGVFRILKDCSKMTWLEFFDNIKWSNE